MTLTWEEFLSKTMDLLMYNAEGNILINAIKELNFSQGNKREWIDWELKHNAIKFIWMSCEYAGTYNSLTDDQILDLAVDYCLCKLTVCYYLFEVELTLRPLYPEHYLDNGLCFLAIFNKKEDLKTSNFLRRIDLLMENDPWETNKRWEKCFDSSDPLNLNIETALITQTSPSTYRGREKLGIKKLKELDKNWFMHFFEDLKNK